MLNPGRETLRHTGPALKRYLFSRPDKSNKWRIKYKSVFNVSDNRGKNRDIKVLPDQLVFR